MHHGPADVAADPGRRQGCRRRASPRPLAAGPTGYPSDALDAWAREGKAPPESRHPRFADGTMAHHHQLKFPAVPGVQWPTNVPGGYRWDVDTEDWKVRDSGRILARATVPGKRQLILAHDGGGERRATVEALPAIIAHYKAQGARFVELCTGKAPGKS